MTDAESRTRPGAFAFARRSHDADPMIARGSAAVRSAVEGRFLVIEAELLEGEKASEVARTIVSHTQIHDVVLTRPEPDVFTLEIIFEDEAHTSRGRAHGHGLDHLPAPPTGVEEPRS